MNEDSNTVWKLSSTPADHTTISMAMQLPKAKQEELREPSVGKVIVVCLIGRTFMHLVTIQDRLREHYPLLSQRATMQFLVKPAPKRSSLGVLIFPPGTSYRQAQEVLANTDCL